MVTFSPVLNFNRKIKPAINLILGQKENLAICLTSAFRNFSPCWDVDLVHRIFMHKTWCATFFSCFCAKILTNEFESLQIILIVFLLLNQINSERGDITRSSRVSPENCGTCSLKIQILARCLKMVNGFQKWGYWVLQTMFAK